MPLLTALSFTIPYRLIGTLIFAVLPSLPVIGPGDPARAQTLNYRSPDSVPPSWTQFSKLVKYRFEEWISADDAVATRLRGWLNENAGKVDGPPATLVVRAWLNPDGSVERVSFPVLSDSRATDDLRLVLTGQCRGGAAPGDAATVELAVFAQPEKIERHCPGRREGAVRRRNRTAFDIKS
jgi:hypothetical protein